MNWPRDNWLLVEDDDDDVFFFRRACQSAFDQPPVLYLGKNGVDAKGFLAGHPDLPSLIVSDLKMPCMDGLELLKWVRQQPFLSGVPFFMLSSSDLAQDRQAARSLGANDYLVKPSSREGLVQLIRGVHEQCLTDSERHIREQEV